MVLVTLPFFMSLTDDSTTDVARLIQTALTPVFMLSGVGTLLNLFNTRLVRVSDEIKAQNESLIKAADDAAELKCLHDLRHLARRVRMLDAAVLFGGIAGASTCGAAFILFFESIHNSSITSWLILLFGGALLCTILSLGCFLGDSVLAWHNLHIKTAKVRDKIENLSKPEKDEPEGEAGDAPDSPDSDSAHG